jgi:hypothetical protein
MCVAWPRLRDGMPMICIAAAIFDWSERSLGAVAGNQGQKLVGYMVGVMVFANVLGEIILIVMDRLFLYIPLDIVDWVCYYAMYHESGSLILLFAELNMYAYTYDLGITPIRLQAGGCLTTKNLV